MPEKEKLASWITVAANTVLAGAGFLSLLVLLYVAYHHIWLGDREITGATALLAYYGVPAAASALLFGSLLLRPSIRENLALIVVSAGISLVGAEIILEATKPRHTTLWIPSTRQEVDRLVTIARQYGVEYDTRSHLQVVRDLRRSGVDAVPPLYPFSQFEEQADGTLKSRTIIDGKEVFALSGVSNRLTVFCNESGQWLTYVSDEHGFHNPRGIWSSEAIDVAVVGDSYAHGACVPSDQNFVSVIRERYPATLSLGNSNKGPLLSLAGLKEFAAPFKPGIVLWFFYEENDFADMSRSRRSPLLMRYLKTDSTQRLRPLQAKIDSVLESRMVSKLDSIQTEWPEAKERKSIIPAFLKLSHVRGLLGLKPQQRIDRSAEMEQTIGLLADILSNAKETVDSWGGRLYLVYLPERERYAQARVARVDEKKRERVLAVARSVGVEVIDIHVAFESTGDPLGLFPFRLRGHYNEKGHRLVGEAVLQSISPRQ